MRTERILWDLRAAGCSLFIGPDGVVHGRMLPGHKMPLEARSLVTELQAHNEEAAALIRAEQTEVFALSEFDRLAAEYWARMMDGNRLQLGGPILVDKQADTVTIIMRQVALDD